MKIIQHIPNACESDAPIHQEFMSLEELLAIEFVAKWSYLPKFHQYSIYPHRKTGGHKKHKLMAEMDDGKEWWVIGLLVVQKPEALGLPMWTPPDKEGTMSAYYKQQDAIEMARNQLRAQGISYPLYDITATVDENYSRILAFAEKEAALVVQILREAAPKPVTSEPPKKQWTNYNDQ